MDGNQIALAAMAISFVGSFVFGVAVRAHDARKLHAEPGPVRVTEVRSEDETPALVTAGEGGAQ